MIRVNKIILLLAIMLIANALDTPVSAKEIVADSDTEGTFESNQEIVNNPSSGNEILVYSSVYESAEIGVQNTQFLGKSGHP